MRRFLTYTNRVPTESQAPCWALGRKFLHSLRSLSSVEHQPQRQKQGVPEAMDRAPAPFEKGGGSSKRNELRGARITFPAHATEKRCLTYFCPSSTAVPPPSLYSMPGRNERDLWTGTRNFWGGVTTPNDDSEITDPNVKIHVVMDTVKEIEKGVKYF